MIKVMLVDDQNLVRKGVRSLLELSPEIEVIAEAADGAEAIRLIPEAGPDVVLLDMRMPGLSGLDVLRDLAGKGALPPTIILTTFDDDELVLAGIQSGARGYLLKDVSADELVRAIRAAHAGRATLSPAAAQSLVEAANQPPAPGLDLTEREREVLALMIEGLNNTQIAGRLGVSPSTIKSHVSNILSKLGVASRTEAVTLALRHGIVP